MQTVVKTRPSQLEGLTDFDMKTKLSIARLPYSPYLFANR